MKPSHDFRDYLSLNIGSLRDQLQPVFLVQAKSRARESEPTTGCFSIRTVSADQRNYELS